MARIPLLALVGLLSLSLFGMGRQAETPASAGLNSRLVGAWEVESLREQGIGKNLLTFSSDGTFFRSGDTHPTLSGGHGAWMQVSATAYHGSYVALRFDAAGKWIGYARNRLLIEVNADGASFTGVAKTSTRDLDDKEIKTGETRLRGRKIEVESP